MVTKSLYYSKSFPSGNTVKSLYLQYLQGNVVIVNYHKLNSTCDYAPRKSQTYDMKPTFMQKTIPDHREEPLTFEYTINNTNVKVKKLIHPLKSLGVDIISWTQEFRQLVKCCQWSEETQMEVLDALLSTELQSLVHAKKSCESRLEELLRLKFPKQDSFYYQEKLISIKQKNFYLIEDYYKEIEEITKRLAIAQSMSQKEIQRTITNSFFAGLDNKCRVKFIEDGIQEIEIIMRRISEVERFLIEKNHKPPQQNTEHSREIRRDKYKTKFCHYHKTASHNDTECLAQKNTTGNGDRKKYKASVIKDSSSYSSLIKLNIFLESSKNVIEALIDSGATRCYINSEVCAKNKLDVVRIEPICIELANKNKLKVHEKCTITFKALPSKKIFKLSALVLKDLSNDLIIGNDFLFEN
ncbi:hypothetical protein H312_02553, partial [Anncaliia algerae PRA339]